MSRRNAILIAAALVSALGGLGAARAQEEPPGGSYLQTCRVLSYSDNVLSASCRSQSGDMRASSLNVVICDNADIQNVNGRLWCFPSYGDQTQQ